jgi:hypothetical protein
MKRSITAGFIVLLVLAACSSEPPAAEPTAEPENPRLEGVVLAIESTSLDDVTSFTLKDGDETYEIYIADDVEYGFPLGHLQEHVQQAAPVAVDTEERDGKLYALTIEDV